MQDNGKTAQRSTNRSIAKINDTEVITMLSGGRERFLVVVSWDATGQVLEASGLLETMTRLRNGKPIS